MSDFFVIQSTHRLPAYVIAARSGIPRCPYLHQSLNFQEVCDAKMRTPHAIVIFEHTDG